MMILTPTASRSSPPRAIYRILVRDLRVMCRIGIHDHERLSPQRVRINVELAVAEAVGATTDDIKSVYNYEDVMNGIKAVVAADHINLVETLADAIAAHCLKNAMVEEVLVRVEKLDVYAEAESVGIEIRRKQRRIALGAYQSVLAWLLDLVKGRR